MLNIDKETLSRLVEDAVKAEQEACAGMMDASAEHCRLTMMRPEVHACDIEEMSYGRQHYEAAARMIRARGES